VSPSSGTTGGGTAVTLTGTNLSGATGVSFGGAAGKVTADSGTQITVTSPAGTGTVNITVTTPGGSAGAGTFTYMTPAPVVTALSPSSGTTAGGTAVMISGTNLGGATVSFGGAAAKIAADSGTQITVTSPPGSAGAVIVTVTTPGGTSSGNFTYVIPAPAISAISPSSGSTQGGTTVTISGANLAGATSVTFGGVAAKIAADSGTQITVTSPPGTAGTVTVTVTTAGGTASASFTYAPPVIE
jgi:IPT/TIG domain